MSVTAYPAAYDTIATNKLDTTPEAGDHPQHHDLLASAVNAIERELGISPSGPFATVAERLGRGWTLSAATPDDYYADGVSNATTTFTSATASFTAADVGKTIVILRAGPSNFQDHHTTISAVTNSTTVTLANATGRSQTSCRFLISRAGDQLATIQAEVDALEAAGAGTLLLGGVGFLVSASVKLGNRVHLAGLGHHGTMLHLKGGITAVPVVTNKQTANNSAQGCGVRDIWLDGNRLRNSDFTTTLAAAYTAGDSTLTLTAAPPQPSGSLLIGTNRLHYDSVSGSGPYTLNNVFGGMEDTTDANAANGATVTQHNGHGVYFAPVPFNTTPTTADSTDVPWHLIQNVYAKNCKGDGVSLFGWSETKVFNLFSHYADHFGFRPSFDTFWDLVTSDTAGRSGLYSLGSQAGGMMKSYSSGGNVAAEGNGALIEGYRGTLEEGAKILDLYVQDNKAHGVKVRNAEGLDLRVTASSNGTSSAGTYSGMKIDGVKNSLVNLISRDRTAGTATQQNALDFAETSTSNDNLDVRVTHGASSVTSGLGSTVKSGSVVTGTVRIVANGVLLNTRFNTLDLTGQKSLWTPQDRGLLAVTSLPEFCANTFTPTAGQAIYARARLVKSGTIGHVRFIVSTASSSNNANCFVAVYSADGQTRLGVSSDMSTAIRSTGDVPVVCSAGAVVADDEGYVWIALLIGTQGSPTAAVIRSHNSLVLSNFGLSSSSPFLSGTLGSGLSALPTTFDPTALSASVTPLLAAAP